MMINMKKGKKYGQGEIGRTAKSSIKKESSGVQRFCELFWRERRGPVVNRVVLGICIRLRVDVHPIRLDHCRSISMHSET
jgi:hypothetical protein